MKALLYLLCLTTAAFGAVPTPAKVTAVVPGEIVIDERLVDVLAGIDTADVQQRLQRVIRDAGATPNAQTPTRHRDQLCVTIAGGRASPRACVFSVTISLRQLAWNPASGKEEMKTVSQRVVSGQTSPSGLSIQVIVAVEDQAALLLNEAMHPPRAKMAMQSKQF